jgi:predicted neutral ceramidase superfamily lipid hydrolase
LCQVILLNNNNEEKMEKNSLTPEESLAIIGKSITNFKMNYKESAKIFLLWGWILTFASISNFIIIKILHNKEAYESMGLFSLLNWVVFAIIGYIVLFFLNRKIDKDKKVYSYLENYIKKLWIVTAVSFFIAIILCIQLEITPPAIMLLIAGIATTTSGLLIKFKPMIIGGMSFFIFSIATTFVSNEYLSLIVGAAIICGYLIPGYLLKSAKE